MPHGQTEQIKKVGSHFVKTVKLNPLYIDYWVFRGKQKVQVYRGSRCPVYRGRYIEVCLYLVNISLSNGSFREHFTRILSSTIR